MKQKEHIVQLDGLRFFAVLMVMIAHWQQWRFIHPALKEFPFVHGVTLFFVLSGFLITKILLENREKSRQLNLSTGQVIKSFYIRRALRILPIYYVTIFVLVYIDYPGAREYFPWLASFTTNLYQSVEQVYLKDFNHFWSLGVEEQFYLVWPWVMLFVSQKRLHQVIVATIAMALCIKVALYLMYPENWMANAYLPFTCMHALGLGALLAYFAVYRQEIFKKAGNAVFSYAATLVFLLGFYVSYKMAWYGYKLVIDEFVFAIAAFFIIARAAQNRFTFLTKYILEIPFVTYSGRISYGMYVLHLFMQPFYYYLAPTIELYVNHEYTLFVLSYFFTFTMAHFSWIILERPINKLKEKFPYYKLPVTEKAATVV